MNKTELMYCTKTTIKDIKKGEFFVLKEVDENGVKYNNVYVKDVYCRDVKKYGAYKYSDVNHYSVFKADRIVYTDFTF